MNFWDGWFPNQWPGNPSPQVKFNGLINQGATCYLNSVLQVLFMTEDFREAVERFAHDNPETECIDRQLNDLFDELKIRTALTYKITNKLKISRVHEQRDAAEYFEKILKLTSSEASQVFHGTLTHRTICSHCEKTSDSDGKFWHLPLPLNSDGEYNVTDGINEFFRDTHFSGDMKMYCDNCDGKYDATIKCVLKHPPEVLMLLLKRFELNIYTLTYYKNKRTVRVPCRLQISENQTYELYALVEHFGELGSGHYWANIKSEEDGRWYRFNDTTVTLLDYQPFQSDNFERSDRAYLLFYRKQRDQAAASCPPQDTGDVSPPKECLPSSIDNHDQPPNSEDLITDEEMAEENRAVGVISDQDDDGGLKGDEDNERAKRPSPVPCFEEENHVDVEGNHCQLQLQDKLSDQGRLVPNAEEAERGSECKKNLSLEANKEKDEDQTCEVKLKEPINTSQYDQESIQEVNIHENPQNEEKAGENERIDAEGCRNPGENVQNSEYSFLRGVGLVERRETAETRGEARAESNLDKMGEKQTSTNSRELKFKIYEKTEAPDGSKAILIREGSLQRTSDSKGNSLMKMTKEEKVTLTLVLAITKERSVQKITVPACQKVCLYEIVISLDRNTESKEQWFKIKMTKHTKQGERAESETLEYAAEVKHETTSEKLCWPSSAKKPSKEKKKSKCFWCVSIKFQSQTLTE